MELNDFLTTMGSLTEQINILNKQKTSFAKKAYDEKLFEVEIGELKSEMTKLIEANLHDPKITVHISEIWLPSPIRTKEAAKNYIINHKPELRITFNLYERGAYMAETHVPFSVNMSTSDGQNVFDNMILKEPSFDNDLHYSLAVPKNIQNKLLININPLSPFMTGTSGLAVHNCIKNKENCQKIKENTEKNK